MTVGSLFTGIGGLDLALERFGARVIWHAEMEPAARRVLAEKFPGMPCFRDVKEIDATTERPDILCGGFPCQDISVAGAGAGIEGDRSGLWGEFARIIRALQPAIVFIENVAALASRGLDRVLRDLAEIGFDAEWDVVSAAEVGAPHKRERIFILAYAGVGLADAHRDALRILAEWDQRRGRGERTAECGDAVALDDRGAVADAAGARRGSVEDAIVGRGSREEIREGEAQSDGRDLDAARDVADADGPRREGQDERESEHTDPSGCSGEGGNVGLADAESDGRREGIAASARQRRDTGAGWHGGARSVADSDSGRREGVRFLEPDGQRRARGGEPDGRSGARRLDHVFPPGPDRIGEWPGPQPAVRRGDAGIPAGMDRGWRAKNRTAERLQLLGNACCPQQAARAIEPLAPRALAEVGA